jgi:hypothetical protein
VAVLTHAGDDKDAENTNERKKGQRRVKKSAPCSIVTGTDNFNDEEGKEEYGRDCV